MLWVERGEALWKASASPGGASCQSCHGDPSLQMTGVSARYPRIDPGTGELRSIELQINACRTRRLSVAPFDWEAEALLAITALLAHRSRGAAISVATTDSAHAHYERGRRLFHERQGQLNLSCANCHDENIGKNLRGDVISEGHPTGFPIYRLEWQTLGSLQRRLRACSLGVRAEVLDFGSDDYVALELYLAARANGMRLEGPAIRK
ncbi:MAG TPA: sulfur oxidation c-type cytochrome SoxA [Hyphomicrobiaceae bacterium]|nr:sulfur oxidation c-type cytochrome SoxA [Hyphomicrobiaceae bacterium]